MRQSSTSAASSASTWQPSTACRNRFDGMGVAELRGLKELYLGARRPIALRPFEEGVEDFDQKGPVASGRLVFLRRVGH